MSHKYTNRLIHESSPYLLQHAHNPVDWYSWGEEAFQKAREEDKPILLSIGYSACHWCHVMEHESFESEEIAEIMNHHFVNIKVDREERPDLDHVYQTVVQLLTGHGGWPLTAFLTPDQKPFFGGTYFPPQDRHGLPGFPRLLLTMAKTYREQKAEISTNIIRIMAALDQTDPPRGNRDLPDATLLAGASQTLQEQMDLQWGGFGRQPKFPNCTILDLLLRQYQRSRKREFLDPVLLTLRKMAQGGIYDHLGGGFHRYSVDNRWFAPHFEKMLYDNALLPRIYLAAYQITGEPLFAQVVRETLDYLHLEMRDPAGGFYSTQDADSEGEEGKFYLWSQEEILKILGSQSGELFCRVYNVTKPGNFEERNILNLSRPMAETAAVLGMEPAELEGILKQSREKLRVEREKRVKPFRDEKIQTAWNGLAISTLAMASQVLDDERYLKAARQALDFIESHLEIPGNQLLHTYKENQTKIKGFLEDYAYLIEALLETYQACGEQSYLDKALRLHRTMLDQFWDSELGGFFLTASTQEPLIVRPRDSYDQSVPSGTSVATRSLLRLHHFTGEERHRETAEKVFRLFRESMAQNPFGFGNLLCALDDYLEGPTEVTILADPSDPTRREMIRVLYSVYLPNLILHQTSDGGVIGGTIGKYLNGKGKHNDKTTAYVCRHFSCSQPVTSAADLKEVLTQS